MKRSTIFLSLLALVIGASAATNNLTLKWDANPPSDGVNGYNIYWKNVGFPGAIYSRLVSTTNTTWTWTNINPGSYSFHVRAVNAVGESLPSIAVNAVITTAPRGAPGAPTNVTVSVTFIP